MIIATGRKFNTFTTPFLLSIAPICESSHFQTFFLTSCWGHLRIEATKLANPESSSSSPCPRGPTASRLQAKVSNPSWDLLDLDLVLYCKYIRPYIEVPTHSKLHAYRKEPNPLTLAFPTPLPGPSHSLAPTGLCLIRYSSLYRSESSTLRLSSFVLRPLPLRVQTSDALSGKGTHTSWHWRT